MPYAVGNMSMPWLDEQVVCNLYALFFSHSCLHTDGAGHGNDLWMEDLIIFQRSFWRCWLHLVICQLSGVRFWPRAEAHVELIWHALDGTPASVSMVEPVEDTVVSCVTMVPQASTTDLDCKGWATFRVFRRILGHDWRVAIPASSIRGLYMCLLYNGINIL